MKENQCNGGQPDHPDSQSTAESTTGDSVIPEPPTTPRAVSPPSPMRPSTLHTQATRNDLLQGIQGGHDALNAGEKRILDIDLEDSEDEAKRRRLHGPCGGNGVGVGVDVARQHPPGNQPSPGAGPVASGDVIGRAVATSPSTVRQPIPIRTALTERARGDTDNLPPYQNNQNTHPSPPSGSDEIRPGSPE